MPSNPLRGGTPASHKCRGYVIAGQLAAPGFMKSCKTRRSGGPHHPAQPQFNAQVELCRASRLRDRARFHCKPSERACARWRWALADEPAQRQHPGSLLSSLPFRSRVVPELRFRSGAHVARRTIKAAGTTGLGLASGKRTPDAAQVLPYAGALSSPAILMRSGISGRVFLHQLGIRLLLPRLGMGGRSSQHAPVPIRLAPSQRKCDLVHIRGSKWLHGWPPLRERRSWACW